MADSNHFSLKTHINLGGSPTKFSVLIGNSLKFKFGVKNLTGSRILAVSAHAPHKIG